MRKVMTLLLISCGLIFSLAGCLGSHEPEEKREFTRPPAFTFPLPTPTPDPEPEESKPYFPSEAEVLAARAQALDGMTQEEIRRLALVIQTANLWWENKYLWGNIFQSLQDPEDPCWNYFEETGEIHIGWAYDGSLDEMEKICALEGLTVQEFYKKYGTRIVTYHDYDADAFIALLAELQATVHNDLLRRDLQYIMDETRFAQQTHVAEHANNLYKALHDMDYYLLRYAGDITRYMNDGSTMAKYYGTLSFYP